MRRTKGFTLLEIMATVLVMALMLGLVLPGLGATRTAELRDNARELAAHLEMARQRAVMTGVPHRVLLSIDESAYRIEWYASEEIDLEEEEDEELGESRALGGATPLSLSPPRGEDVRFRPLPSRFGRDVRLRDEFLFEGVQTPEGWLDSGQVGVAFYRDGTSDTTEIVIGDGEGRRLSLDVLPLLDVVRIRDDGG
ncbi:MAG: prepilin-type N-terminal cleavage/methylation domain-containing protein [Proteobacteria bacterium]|nr:prepilin-type N-terminal cleavage/methylation domain-containing protein [Pseudomonadota bacterium]